MWLFELFLLNSANLICRDNESRLYFQIGNYLPLLWSVYFSNHNGYLPYHARSRYGGTFWEKSLTVPSFVFTLHCQPTSWRLLLIAHSDTLYSRSLTAFLYLYRCNYSSKVPEQYLPLCHYFFQSHFWMGF